MPLFDPKSVIRPFRHRPFALYSTGNGFSLLGTWMQRVATGWLTWELTESGTWLGVIAAAEFLPSLLVAPLAGAAADRWDRLALLKAAQAIQMMLTLILFGVIVLGTINIWHLLILNTAIGTVSSFVQPARLAFVPSLVPRPELGSAVAVNSMMTNLSRFIGPMIAGFVIVGYGVSGVYLFNGLSYGVFYFVLGRLKVPQGEAKPAKKAGVMSQLREGLAYTIWHPGISSVLLLLIAMALGARPLIDLMPGFAGAVFERGAAGLSTLIAAVGIGAVIGSAWVSGRPIGRGYFNTALFCTALMAVAVMVFAVNHVFWLGVAIVTVFGFAASAAQICMQTLVQLAVDRSMAGRVLSVYGLIFRSSPALGALAIGAASEVLGLQLPMFFGGVLLAVVCLRSFLRRRTIAAALEAGAPGGGEPPKI